MKHKKIFIMTGESSGDALAAWYIQRQREQGVVADYTAIAGSKTAATGAQLYRGIDDLSIVGVVEIVRHLPRIFTLMAQIVAHVIEQGYDEVVVVDYPGFNLRLIKRLKKKIPYLPVIYLSPPQLWVWGAWRVRSLQRFADRVIVLYPFEVEWYQQRKVHAVFMGSPVVERMAADVKKLSLSVPVSERVNQIAFLPGSRRQEITHLMHHYAPVLKKLSAQQKDLRIAVIVAPSLSQQQVQEALSVYNPESWDAQIEYITDADKALRAITHSVCALTKPGTNTLELALLGVPGVVIYKTSWLTYWLARCVVKVTSMTLPNLLLNKQIYPEFIQQECQTDAIVVQLYAYFDVHQHDRGAYLHTVAAVMAVRKVLCDQS